VSWPLEAGFIVGLAAQTGNALAVSCNTNHYTNSDSHLVHSPSCGEEPQKPTAECRDGSVSFSEHHTGTSSVALLIGTSG
jgi:Protein of unknown function (DUF3761)